MRDVFILRLPLEIKEAMAKRAREIGIPLHALVLHILWEYVERRGLT